MVLFGLLLLAIGVILALLGVFTADTESQSSGGKTDVHATFMGLDVAAPTLFVVGMVAAALILLGLWCMKFGAKQGWKRHKETKRLNELHDRMVEADRHEARDGDDQT